MPLSSNTSSRHAWLVGSSLVGGGRPSPFYRPVAAATMMVAPSPLQREHTFAPPPLRGRPHPTPNWCSLIQIRKSCSPHVHYTPVSGVGNTAHVTFMPSPPHPGAPFLVKPIKEPQRGRRCRGTRYPYSRPPGVSPNFAKRARLDCGRCCLAAAVIQPCKSASSDSTCLLKKLCRTACSWETYYAPPSGAINLPSNTHIIRCPSP